MPWHPRFDWIRIQAYHEEGHSVRECAKKFGFSIGGWYKARSRGWVTTISGSKYRCRYDWKEIQAYYDEGHTWAVCKERFGFSARTWQKARDRGAIHSRPVKKPLDILFQGKNRSAIKRRLLAEGLLRNQCSRCGISEWQGKPLSIQIDHINGVNDDYRLENLRMLCANCHALTPTHGRKNVGKRLSPLVLPWKWGGRRSQPDLSISRNPRSRAVPARLLAALGVRGVRAAQPTIRAGPKRSRSYRNNPSQFAQS